MAIISNPKFEKMFNEFKKLPNSEKKQRIIEIYELIKDKVDFGKWIIQFMKNAGEISDGFLENNYTIIMNAALQSCDEQNDKVLENQLNKINALKEEEKKQQDMESEEVDNLINSM